MIKIQGTFEVNSTPNSVSFLLEAPENAKGLVVLAHGAGAPMTHDTMNQYAATLTGISLAVFRFNFPYLEKGKGAPNRAPVLIETERLALQKAREVFQEVFGAAPDKTLFAGKSMGGRMASLAEAELPMDINGLIFFGFPLHAPGKPGKERAAHLHDIDVPMLFIQGTRDTLANLELVTEVCDSLPNATLFIVEGGDHSHKVLKRLKKSEAEVMGEIQEVLKEWVY